MQKALLLFFCAATVELPAQTLTVLANFSQSTAINPQGGALVQGTDGNFYGTSLEGGASGRGTVYKVTPAGAVTVLYGFAGADGQSPMSGLVQASDGNLYGTTYGGGANGDGTIFKITLSGTLTTLHSFCAQANCADGKYPMSGLIQATDGNLYGTTSAGGAASDGTIFKITPAGSYSVLYNFSGTDGSTPYCGLMQASDGNLYGATGWGGATGAGTIFKITLAGTLNTLHSFVNTDGLNPHATPVQASDGNLYGTTERGGTNSLGTVFKITTSGTFTSLYSFSGTDGQQIDTGLVQASDGNLYGAAGTGGANSVGTVFKMTLAGALTTVHTFATTDGAKPLGTLIKASDGNLYGTTEDGGANSCGAVFKIAIPAPLQAPTVTTGAASSVTGTSATLGGSVNPNGADTQVWFLYGTNNSLIGASSTPRQDMGSGTASAAFNAAVTGLGANTTYYFQAWASSAGGTSEGSIVSFTTAAGTASYTVSGTVTLSGSGLAGVTITVSGSGNASITTTSSGTYAFVGTAGGSYTVTPSLAGYTFTPPSATFNNLSANQTANFTAAAAAPIQTTFATVASFSGTNGSDPRYFTLLLGADGNFYGTADEGGANGDGTVFQVTPAGVLAALHSFAGTDGTNPASGLIQASDGNFYGSAYLGGANNGGTVFKVTPAGALTTLYNFCASSNCADGKNPGSLVQASDGNLYGTTLAGGANSQGTIFRITLAGALSTLHSFATTDGAGPYAGLIQASDGNLYGTTSLGGASGDGTIFRASLAGGVTVLHSFNATDGASPYGNLIQARDGSLYGTTVLGGANNYGVIFKTTLAGTFTLLYNFAGTDGEHPYDALVQAADGNFYGTTYQGGAYSAGSIFQMTAAGALTTLHSFGGASGYYPFGGLVQAADGSLYGATSMGGAQGYGSVYKLSFGTAVQAPTVTTGAASGVTAGNAVLGGSANPNGSDTKVWFLYGTNSSLSASTQDTSSQDIGSGTSAVSFSANVAALNPNTTYYFQAVAQSAGGTSKGSIASFTTGGTAPTYTISGTVSLSGTDAQGISMALSGSQTGSTTTDVRGSYSFTVNAGGTYTVTPSIHAYTFSPASATFNNVNANQTANFTGAFVSSGAAVTILASLTKSSNGQDSVSGVVQASDGNFYGPAAFGGSYYGSGISNGAGTVFEVTPAGVATALHNFVATDGQWPQGQLIQANDGDLYGTALKGGANGGGTIFKISLAGAFTTLYNFCAQTNCSDGEEPFGQLLQASDGNLYGAATAGGNNNKGTIFKITPAGALTTLYTFTGGSDGGEPTGFLIQAMDGNLYGSTSAGAAGNGTIFRLTLGGILTTLYTFTANDGFTGPDGAGATLTQAGDGSFYGTTIEGGPAQCGTIFKMTPAGALTSLFSFSKLDGCVPFMLLRASDGNLYGETRWGGIVGEGTLYQVTPAGTVTTLHLFSGSDGNSPTGGLIQATDGYLYGTTQNGGANNDGVVFRLGLPPPAVPAITAGGIVSGASYQAGIAANSWITIYGTNLSPVTDIWTNAVVNGNLPQSLDGVRVSVGGQPAYVEYISPGQINVLAPNVAPGNVEVTVSGPNGTSTPAAAVAQAAQPAFFQWGNYAVATRPDYSLAVKNGTFSVTTVPAKPGDSIILWGTGFGPTNPAAPPGVVVPSSTSYLTGTVTVTVGGVAASVYGSAAALTSGDAGLYQVAIQIPATLADGDYPVIATVAGAESPSTVLITVQQ